VNETQWLTSTDPRDMVASLPLTFSTRKLRLFACACVHNLPISWESPVRTTLAVAERLTEGQATAQELQAASITAWPHKWEGIRSTFVAVLLGDGEGLLGRVQRFLAAAADRLVRNGYRIDKTTSQPSRVSWEGRFAAAHQAQADLLRHVVNPFGCAATSESLPSEVTGLAEALANGVDRTFALHDALLEVGYADRAEHFCDPNQRHPRGCFALDQILGRS
jgi:hypothetical protein